MTNSQNSQFYHFLVDKSTFQRIIFLLHYYHKAPILPQIEQYTSFLAFMIFFSYQSVQIVQII